MSKLNALSTNDLFWSEAEALEWDKWERNSIRQDIINQGIEQNTKNIIKTMLEDKVDLKTISKYTGKSIKEIKELQ